MEKEKLSRKHQKNPSFSSTLLDEIYRSIDGYDHQIRGDHFKLPKKGIARYTKHPEMHLPTKNYNSGAKAKVVKNSSVEDEEIASFRRACLIEKWMEKKVKDKVIDNDPMFFSSSCSDSSSGTLSASSSEADSFYSEKTSRTTCFAAPRTKSLRRASENPLMYSDEKGEESLIKSKSRAYKIYNNLKKVKQPISPGGRLTSFLSSIFNNGNAKKSKNLKGFEDVNVERNLKSGQASTTCSSASSFSRSCLSKTPPKFRENYQNGVKRTVRFNPVGVIVDEDCRPCGHKFIHDKDTDVLKRPKFQGNGAIMEKNRKFDVTKSDSLKNYQHLKQKKNDCVVDYAEEEDEYDFDDDAASDSSSDLFEIDHLAFFGDNRFCEELPVYETTRIASGYIR